jgi:hypothetical protein
LVQAPLQRVCAPEEGFYTAEEEGYTPEEVFCTVEDDICMPEKSSAHVSDETDTIENGKCGLEESAGGSEKWAAPPGKSICTLEKPPSLK